MSTYYYLICEDCKERTNGASRSAGGPGYLVDSDYTLPPFIITHCGHDVKIVSEHDDRSYDNDYTDWTQENIEELYRKGERIE